MSSNETWLSIASATGAAIGTVTASCVVLFSGGHATSALLGGGTVIVAHLVGMAPYLIFPPVGLDVRAGIRAMSVRVATVMIGFGVLSHAEWANLRDAVIGASGALIAGTVGLMWQARVDPRFTPREPTDTDPKTDSEPDLF